MCLLSLLPHSHCCTHRRDIHILCNIYYKPLFKDRGPIGQLGMFPQGWRAVPRVIYYIYQLHYLYDDIYLYKLHSQRRCHCYSLNHVHRDHANRSICPSRTCALLLQSHYQTQDSNLGLLCSPCLHSSRNSSFHTASQITPLSPFCSRIPSQGCLIFIQSLASFSKTCCLYLRPSSLSHWIDCFCFSAVHFLKEE